MEFHLYIMRHAKSDWSGSGVSDLDRQINKRGQENAKQVGQWMQNNHYIPQQIICSPALRAKQTIDLVVKQLDSVAMENIHYEDNLYLANLETLLACIRAYKDNYRSLMLVAHNPGLEQLVSYLADKSAGKIIQNKNMTTANLVIFEYPDTDSNVEVDKGKLLEFIKPKELD